MSENAKGGKALIAEFKSLKPKQLVSIVLALVIALILEVMGFGTQCFGFLIIAVILYMIPHVTGVMSPKVKAIIGVAFIAIALPVGTFMYADAADEFSSEMGEDTTYIKDLEYDPATGVLSAQFTEAGVAEVEYGIVDSVAFGAIMVKTTDDAVMTVDPVTFAATVTLDLQEGKLYFMSITYDFTREGVDDAGKSFTLDTGLSSSDGTMLSFTGAAYLIAYAMVIFYFILIITTIMRSSASKARSKMEAQGRLYPQGYGRCKKCGAMVLPGEVNCRKCGEYIDVPDEMRAKKKDFFVCESCGAEVPADAKACPRCGVSFDEVIEAEIVHTDGTVDTSTETFECSECGAEVPVNAKRCPKCGAEFDDE